MSFSASIRILSLLFFLLFFQYLGGVLCAIGGIISIRYTNIKNSLGSCRPEIGCRDISTECYCWSSFTSV